MSTGLLEKTFLSDSPFPVHGLVPKAETQAASFLAKYPEYDGRGVRVAILDMGVDPAAAGLNGKGKIVDIIDCTGSGDIPLKLVQPSESDHKDTSIGADAIRLNGISGRTILVSSEWSNPTNVWKVGFKRAYDLWPADLVKRRTQERRLSWEVQHAALISAAQKDLAELDRQGQDTLICSAEVGKSGQASAVNAEKARLPTMSCLAEPGKVKRLDLTARLEHLTELEWEDPGPLLDAVVFHDGKDWRAVVGGAEGDTEQNIAEDADGKQPILDIRFHKPMTDFRKEKQYERFGTLDSLSYSVNIVDDGNVLSLAIVSGTHGTHVAAIVGGRVEDQPDLNGVAPNVEMVSLKIGDTRLGSSETTQALMRATKAIIDTECDICNLSYNEDAAWGGEDRGQFIQMLRDEVVKKRNVLFVSSAGNAGPALSTIGAPATTSDIISVEAYVSPETQDAQYSLLGSVPAGPYTWSARGPVFNGANEFIYAPGGAFTAVPTYSLQKNQHMDGTSMAAPHVCGAISLVLSALKAQGIPYSPARIRRGLQATTKDVGDILGVGIIQTEALYQYLLETRYEEVLDVDFDISIVRLGQPAPDLTRPLGVREGMRGIYLRQPEETSRVHDATCYVKPSFPSFTDIEKLYGLDLKLKLVSTADWVRAPPFLALASAARSFNVRVDPTGLAPGLHYAEIKVYNAADPGRLLFTVPVTVCKPAVIDLPSHTFDIWHSSAGHVKRWYLAVPSGATWAELRLTTRKHTAPVNLWLHTVQLQPQVRLSKTENRFVLNCLAGETITKEIKVVGGVTLELVAAQFWNSLPNAHISMEIHFHGIILDTGNILSIVGGGEVTRLQVSNAIRPEIFSPSIAFDRVSSIIRPSDSTLTPLGDRDVMPDGKRLLQLVSNYNINISKKCNISTSWPVMDNLYDSAFAVLSRIQDSRGRTVKFGRLFLGGVVVEPGQYTVQLQLQHADIKVLNRVRGMAMTLSRSLPEKATGLSLSVRRDHIDALVLKTDYPAGVQILQGERLPLVISTELQGDVASLYSVAAAGDILSGALRLGHASPLAAVPLTYVIPAQAKDDVDEQKDEDTPLLVDLQLTLVDEIKDGSEKREFLNQLLMDNSKHIPLLVARLKALPDEASAEDINTTADAILAQIDETKLAEYCGKTALPVHEQMTDDKRMKKEMDIKKSAWTLAYARKLKASLDVSESRDQQDAMFAKYRQFIATPDKDEELILITAKRDMQRQHFGSAIRALSRLIKEGISQGKYKEVNGLYRQCLRKLSWDLLVEYEERWRFIREPPMAQPW